METLYLVVDNNPKKGEPVAHELKMCLDAGWLIVSAIPTQTSVHYIVAATAKNENALSDEDAQIIEDNIKTTHKKLSNE